MVYLNKIKQGGEHMRVIFILLFVLIILIVLYQILLGIDSVIKWRRKQSAKSEECPACKQRIVVGQNPDDCPSCGEKLARNMHGELIIRLN